MAPVFEDIILSALKGMSIPNVGWRIRDGSQETHLNILLADAIQVELDQRGLHFASRTELKRSDIAVQMVSQSGAFLVPRSAPGCVIEAKALSAKDTTEKRWVSRHLRDQMKLQDRCKEGWTCYALLWGRTYSARPPKHWKSQLSARFFSSDIADHVGYQRDALEKFAAELHRPLASKPPICVGSGMVDDIRVELLAYLIPFPTGGSST